LKLNFILFAKNLENLRVKLDELTKTFESLIRNKDNNKNSAEIFQELINLQSNIISKKNMIDQKTSKIESNLKKKVNMFSHSHFNDCFN
jgi:primosomal protein N''